MTALHILGGQNGTVEMVGVLYDVFSVQRILGADSIEIITLGDGIMYIDEHAQSKGSKRNDLASLIAHRHVYGDALIAGFGGDDVPQSYIDAYMIA